MSQATLKEPNSDYRSSLPSSLLVPEALSSAGERSAEAECRPARISNLISRQPTPTRWERAYQAFETREQELLKFTKRLRSIGAHNWNRDLRILEICSGRGTGLQAWHALGFRRVVGVDLSYALVSKHQGPGHCVLGDARALPFPSSSCDVAVVQGGLHHLLTKQDVELALSEMRRVVTPSGMIVIVEPWDTPFLRLIHFVSGIRLVRRISKTFDSLQTMIEEERETYERWLNDPAGHLAIIREHVVPQILRRRWGKVIVLGSPTSAAARRAPVFSAERPSDEITSH